MLVYIYIYQALTTEVFSPARDPILFHYMHLYNVILSPVFVMQQCRYKLHRLVHDDDCSIAELYCCFKTALTWHIIELAKRDYMERQKGSFHTTRHCTQGKIVQRKICYLLLKDKYINIYRVLNKWTTSLSRHACMHN